MTYCSPPSPLACKRSLWMLSLANERNLKNLAMCVTRSEDKQHSLVSSYWHYLQYITVRWLHLEGSFINHDDMTGGGGCQMSLLLHKPYSVKCSTKGDTKMSNKMSTWFMDDPWQLTLHCKLSYKIVFIGMHYYSKVWNKRHFACSEKKNLISILLRLYVYLKASK